MQHKNDLKVSFDVSFWCRRGFSMHTANKLHYPPENLSFAQVKTSASRNSKLGTLYTSKLISKIEKLWNNRINMYVFSVFKSITCGLKKNEMGK